MVQARHLGTLPAVKREWKSVDHFTAGAFVRHVAGRVETLYVPIIGIRARSRQQGGRINRLPLVSWPSDGPERSRSAHEPGS